MAFGFAALVVTAVGIRVLKPGRRRLASRQMTLQILPLVTRIGLAEWPKSSPIELIMRPGWKGIRPWRHPILDARGVRQVRIAARHRCARRRQVAEDPVFPAAHFGFAQQSSGSSGLSCFTATQTSCDGIWIVTAGTGSHLPGQFVPWSTTIRNQVI